MRADWARSPYHGAAVVLFYTLLFCVFFAPVLFGDRLLAPGDALAQYLPAFRSSRGLWEPNVGAGFPVAAEPSNQFFYPPAAIASALGLWNAYVVAAYVLAAAGMYAYVLVLTGSVAAALLSGVVLGMSGHLVAHLPHVHLVHAVAWAPIFLWALERLRSRPRRAWWLVAALSAAHLALAGHPQILLYALTLGGSYALVMAPGSASGARSYRRSVAVAALVGVGLAAVQLVPTAELARLSHRPRLGFDAFVSFDLPPAELPQLFFPLLFGGPLDYLGTWNFTETTGYVGFVAWAAALIAVIAARRRVVWFWAGVALAGLLLAVGDATPLAALTYHLPVFRLFRCPARHLMESTIALSVLAGLGVAELQRRAGEETRTARRAATATLLAVFSVAALTIVTYNPTGGDASTLAGSAADRAALVSPLLFATVGAAALMLFARSPKSLWSTGLLLLVSALELGSFGRGAEWSAQPPSRDVEEIPPALREYRERLTSMRQRAASFYGDGIAAVTPNIGWLWDVPHAVAYMALVVGRVSDLVPFTGAAAVYCEDNRALDLFAARYLFQPRIERGGFEWGPASTLGCGEPGKGSRTWTAADRWATRVALVGALGYSVDVPDGRRVGELRVTTAEGDVVSLPIRAGDDLSDWAYERADVRPIVRHRRARVFARSVAVDARGRRFAALRYVAVFDLGERLRLRSVETVRDGAVEIFVDRMSLRDDRENESRPLLPGRAGTERWRLLGGSEHARVYENLRAMPRAWLVEETLAMGAGAIRRAIEHSRLPDGRSFDPRRTALVEEPVELRPAIGTAAGTAEIVADEGSRLELVTRSDGESFLVVADVDYPGWRATIDGQSAPIHRTNYALRGVVVPAGEHRVRFDFQPWSLYVGLALSVGSLALLTSYRFR